MSNSMDIPDRIDWYRTPLDKETLRALNARSDIKGLLQAGGHLGLLALTGTLAVYGQRQGWPWYALVAVVFVHATFFAFLLNAFHELCHGTVFKTKWLNTFVLRLVSFLSWHNYVWFTASHMNHHRHTLYPPKDLEVVLPQYWSIKDYLKLGFLNPWGFWGSFKNVIRFATGTQKGQWFETCFPETDKAGRKALRDWARFQLAGHAAITIVSLYYGYWMIPLVTTFARCYGEWLMFLCNSTQHVGLMDKVNDFRLNSRTVEINPFLRFLYWNMNFHIEHHMYAAVPTYNLARLHAQIRHDLPPSPKGLVATWTQIAAILKRQQAEPGYQYRAEVPGQ